MFIVRRNGWLLEVSEGVGGTSHAWVSNPQRFVMGYGHHDGSDRNARIEAGTSAIAEAVGCPFTGAELEDMTDGERPPGYCEHCGHGPTCAVCGRGMALLPVEPIPAGFKGWADLGGSD